MSAYDATLHLPKNALIACIDDKKLIVEVCLKSQRQRIKAFNSLVAE